ncbi:MAG: hypothetical protein DMG50_13165 [Acidobacteria bacterium]|nr:MAG: hypothetical protein DMG50_13165 [Acidobacteriota bacterium]
MTEDAIPRGTYGCPHRQLIATRSAPRRILAVVRDLGVCHPRDQLGSRGGASLNQLGIPAPKPPKGSFDEDAAARGKELFEGQAKCATCHVSLLFSEPGWNMHTPEEIGIDDFQANRAPDKRYRTAPLKGLWAHTKGGFFHDGRFATLNDVVQHYNGFFGLGLNDKQAHDLVEYLKSL